MGIVFHELGRFEEAEPLFHRALKIDEASFGPDHPKVARDLKNLASFLQDTHRNAEAEPLFRRVLAIYERNLGDEHPATQLFRNNFEAYLDLSKEIHVR